MEKADFAETPMGVIMCKHCRQAMGTFYSEKVTTYYSACPETECLETRDHVDHEALEA